VNDVRRKTAGSHRFPVNSGDHIQNRFLCQFPASFPPIPALGNGDRIRLPLPRRFPNADPIVFYGAKIRSASCRVRNPDPICFYGAKIWSASCRLRYPDLMTKYNLGISISCFDFGSSHADPRDISWFLDLLVFLMVFSQFFQLKSLFSPSGKFIQPTGNTSKQRKTRKTIEIQQRPIQSIRKTSKITEISRN
jgi:hypothetical protein